MKNITGLRHGGVVSKSVIAVIVAATFLMSGFFVPNMVLAVGEGVNISVATGGEAVSIDTSSASSTSAYTTLDPINISETILGQITVGTHTISLPNGWEFNTSAHITAIKGDGLVLSSYNITPDTTSFSFTVNTSSTVSTFLVLSGMEVRPTVTNIADANGEMTHSGAAIAGVTDGSTSFGTLTSVPGTITKLAFTTQPGATTVYGSDLSTQPVVVTQDQFSNDSSTGATGKTVTLSVDSATVTGTALLDISSGTATFTDVSIDTVGTYQFTASADSITRADSNSFDVTQKGLTVSGLSATSRPYDGTTTAEVTGTPSLVGTVGGDDVSVVGTANGPFDSADAGGRTVEISGLSLAGADSGNYTLTLPTLDSSITAKEVTVTPDSGQNKVYGEADSVFTDTNTALIG
ncbi:MAG: YDG domain-containing protein, partial [Candidatus Komeilibacteria bacterium]|nr:YDG domain-containing protein [Candidatus Komeilibacteria bacterium]